MAYSHLIDQIHIPFLLNDSVDIMETYVQTFLLVFTGGIHQSRTNKSEFNIDIDAYSMHKWRPEDSWMEEH